MGFLVIKTETGHWTTTNNIKTFFRTKYNTQIILRFFYCYGSLGRLMVWSLFHIILPVLASRVASASVSVRDCDGYGLAAAASEPQHLFMCMMSNGVEASSHCLCHWFPSACVPMLVLLFDAHEAGEWPVSLMDALPIPEWLSTHHIFYSFRTSPQRALKNMNGVVTYV